MQTEPIGFKGTDGKWEIDIDTIYSQYAFTDGNIIFDAPPAKWEKSKEKWQYNAQLIAASKDMAIALQGLVGEITQKGYPLHSGMTVIWIDRCREALTKAGL